MAMVTCPGCKKIVDDASGKCPNCGKQLKSDAADKNTPAGKFRMISSVLIAASFVLLLLELFETARTYVGGLLLGAGIFFHGLSQAKLADEEDYIGKRKVLIIYIMGVAIFIGSAVYLIIRLT